MGNVRTFPIMDDAEISAVPWEAMERGRAQAHYNHEQTLERLAERGGLDIAEATVALRGCKLFSAEWRAVLALDEAERRRQFVELLAPHAPVLRRPR